MFNIGWASYVINNFQGGVSVQVGDFRNQQLALNISAMRWTGTEGQDRKVYQDRPIIDADQATSEGESNSLDTMEVVIISIVCFFVLVLFFAVYERRRMYRKKEKAPFDFLALLNHVDGINNISPDELPAKAIQIVELIGEGAFGQVWKGRHLMLDV
jgi:hypothetical protein